MNHIFRKDMNFDGKGFALSLIWHKGKSIRRPLVLPYWGADYWPKSEAALLHRWHASNDSPTYPVALPLAEAVQRVLKLLQTTVPRIGSYTELHMLDFGK